MVPTPETDNRIDSTNRQIDFIKNESVDEQNGLIGEMAEQIAGDPESKKQIDNFHERWESLTSEEKFDFTSKLSAEIKDSIKELKDLGIEEISTEITNEDIKQIKDLEFILANKDKLKSWPDFEKKMNKVAEEMEEEINKKGVLNNEA